MPNPNTIRYSTATQSGALRKGNFYLGVTDRDYGPSNLTGYYNGVTFSSGYLSYLWDGSEIRYNLSNNDSELISFLSSRANLSFSSLTQSLVWSITQSDIMVVEKRYSNILTDSLVINYDANYISSYPKTGLTVYNLNGDQNGTLTNGASFDTNRFTLDGVDDHIDLGTSPQWDFTNGLTIEIAVRFSLLSGNFWERFADFSSINTGTVFSFGRNTSSANIFFQSRNNFGVEPQRRYISSSNPLRIGEISVYSVTLPGGTLGDPVSGCKLYKNGAQIAGAEQEVGVFPRVPTLFTRERSYIARSPIPSDKYINGDIYTFRMYNRELTSSEIFTNYQNTLTQLMNQDMVVDGLSFLVDASYPGSFLTSSNTWFDVSGYSRNGTLQNGTTFSSSASGSLLFDGINDRVEFGNWSISYPTVSAWVYKTSSASSQGICRKNVSWAVSQFNGTLQVAPGTNWTFYNTGYTIPLNTWVNIVYVYSGTGVTGSQVVYVNGSAIWGTSSASGPIPPQGSLVRIGFDDNNWWWGGLISQVSIYDRPLSASEVSQNFNAQKSRYGL